MARTTLTPIDLPGPYTTTPVALTWTAADPANGNQFTLTGNEILLARNDDAGAQTVTVTSTNDPFGRAGDIDAVSIPAGEYRTFQRFKLTGWIQSTGHLYLTASSANVMFAVLRLPAGSA